MESTLLEIRDLKTAFFIDSGTVIQAVDGIDFKIERGEVLALVGESGSGKSVTAYSILGLVPFPGRIVHGDVLFKGESILKKSESEMEEIRGNQIAMVFQDPMTSLNPVLTVGHQVMEPLWYHGKLKAQESRAEALALLKRVGITSAERRIDDYPHQFSGGMRQRVMIALALACRPELLIADEPTTALDVTIQAQILALLKNLQKENQMSILYITHDLGIVAHLANKVMIMYAGQGMEYGDVYAIFNNPRNPYTSALLKSIPSITRREKRLHSIEGTIPNPRAFPAGCRFNPRCPKADAQCRQYAPPFSEIEPNHLVRCWHVD